MREAVISRTEFAAWWFHLHEVHSAVLQSFPRDETSLSNCFVGPFSVTVNLWGAVKFQCPLVLLGGENGPHLSLCVLTTPLSVFLVSSLPLPCWSWPQNFCGFVHTQTHTQIFCLEKLVKCVRDILTKPWAVFWWLEINQRTAKSQACLLGSTDDVRMLLSSWGRMLLSHFSLLFSRSLGHGYFLEKIRLLWWDYAFTDSSVLFFVLVSQVPSFFLDFLFSHFSPSFLPTFLAYPNISSILETPLSWK